MIGYLAGITSFKFYLVNEFLACQTVRSGIQIFSNLAALEYAISKWKVKFLRKLVTGGVNYNKE